MRAKNLRSQPDPLPRGSPDAPASAGGEGERGKNRKKRIGPAPKDVDSGHAKKDERDPGQRPPPRPLPLLPVDLRIERRGPERKPAEKPVEPEGDS